MWTRATLKAEDANVEDPMAIVACIALGWCGLYLILESL